MNRYEPGSLLQCGYDILWINPAAIPFQAVMTESPGRVLDWLSVIAVRVLQTLFAFRFGVVCRFRSLVVRLVQESEQYRLPNVTLLDAACAARSVSDRSIAVTGRR